MAQQVKEPVTKPDDLSSISGTHMIERTDSHTLSSDLHMHTSKDRHAHTKIKTWFTKSKQKNS